MRLSATSLLRIVGGVCVAMAIPVLVLAGADLYRMVLEVGRSARFDVMVAAVLALCLLIGGVSLLCGQRWSRILLVVVLPLIVVVTFCSVIGGVLGYVNTAIFMYSVLACFISIGSWCYLLYCLVAGEPKMHANVQG
jgi:hypothetical protein